ncbi:ROK family protein [Streptomyces sp. MS2A]|nr:ROK family protein [Streptomyces sp. MS2A]
MIVGVDIGGTKIAVAGFDRDGDHVRRATATVTARTPAFAGGTAILETVTDLVRAACGPAIPTAIGVGTAGVIDPAGSVASATDVIREWTGFPLGALLTERTGAPTTVVNDVHAAAVAEARIGAGAGARTLLVVTVGTGIGGAVVIDGELHRGATGTAGSLGHIAVLAPERLATRRCSCGVEGHVEAMASGPALERRFAEMSGSPRPLREVAALAAAGDPVALDVIAEGARLLGHALASANALVDADTIVVGGGVAEIGDRYRAAVADAYRERAMPGPRAARVRAAALGVEATLTGAALLAPAA